jgi:hypothetical protein
MGKATLTFDLDDELDRERFQLATHASGYRDTLAELDEFLRSAVKYQDVKNWPDAQEVRDELYRLMSENGVTLHE